MNCIDNFKSEEKSVCVSKEMYATKNFIGLTAYQPSWVIKRQTHPSRRTVVVLFNP